MRLVRRRVSTQELGGSTPNLYISAPQRDTTAIGFKQLAHKYHIVVTLLLGEIPERSTFRIATLKKSLKPYLHLTNGWVID